MRGWGTLYGKVFQPVIIGFTRLCRFATGPPSQGGRQFGLNIADFLVRGRIDWDPAEDKRVPLLVIDGREVTWEEFGRMLMSFVSSLVWTVPNRELHTRQWRSRDRKPTRTLRTRRSTERVNDFDTSWFDI